MKKILGGIALSISILMGISFGLTSCLNSGSETSPAAQLQKEIDAIDSYLSANSITALTHHSGIRIVVTKLGTGLPAKFSNTVDVDYIGRLFNDNTLFDEGNTKGEVTSFIDGWKIALTTLPEGTKATLYIPSYWAYGTTKQGLIPANSTLVFNIAINKVTQSSQEIQRLTADTTAITAFLDDHSIDAIKDTTGISYTIDEVGTGPIPSWFDKVSFHYSVKLLSDPSTIVFEESVAPSEDFYSRVVYFNHAWKIGLQKMPEGSKATIYAPSGLAYGTVAQVNGQQTVIIPANSNVIIELQLTDVIPE